MKQWNSNIRTLLLHCTLQTGAAIRLKSELTYEVICFTLENSASVGCACTWAKTNLDNYISVIYDMWSLKIWRNNIICAITERTPRHGLEIDFD